MATKNNSKSNIKKRRWLWAVLSSLFILFVSGMVFWANSGAGMLEQRKMESYLEEKYGQKFEVSNVHITGSGLGVEGSWRANAYPLSDPTLEFEIRKPQYSNDTSFYDYETFLETLWSRQARNDIDDFIKRSLPDAKDYSVEVGPGAKLQDAIHGYTPSFLEVKNKYPNQYGYKLSVQSTALANGDEPSMQMLDKAFTLLSFIKSQKSGYPQMKYYYTDKAATNNNQVGFHQYSFKVDGLQEAALVHRPDDLMQKFSQEFVNESKE